MKIVTIIGARPQFIKAGVVSKAIAETPGLNEILIHTGQHFDANMSDVFFEQLGIPKPHYNLQIHGGAHGAMTGKMLEAIEAILVDEKPDMVMIYGDTNSTLAGALAAAKLHIPVAHIEAGLRSFNKKMPEEINRILADQMSDILFCPTDQAIVNLRHEGVDADKVWVRRLGDVMQDSVIQFKDYAIKPAGLEIGDKFILSTFHRAENTDNINMLSSIVNALNEIHKTVAPVVVPLHPRTKKMMDINGLSAYFMVIDPVGYIEMLWLLDHCDLVLTDSGGLQKEAYFFGKYCLTLREETEWVELVDQGFNTLVGTDADKIIRLASEKFGVTLPEDRHLYGQGDAAAKIVDTFLEWKRARAS